MGFGHLNYASVAHPLVLGMPGVAKLVGLPLNEGQKRYHVDDYVRLFEEQDLDVLAVAPEGEYSMYGNGLDIQPFRSPRSLEIALKADCEIILVTCRGYELWQKNIDIQAPWKKKILKKAMLMVPFLDKIDDEYLQQANQYSMHWMTRRIPDFYVYSKKYEPLLKKEDLHDDLTLRKEQLQKEADRMRHTMQAMVNELKEK